MSKHEEADLILKLYELRRDPTMREARQWYFLEFHPETIADFQKAIFGEHSGHLRMVASYWDMAAALVNHGAISRDLFADTNAEHIGTFAKCEPLLKEIRATVGPNWMVNLEKLIDAIPGAREETAATRERMKRILAAVSNQAAAASR
jgi:hypothetical protein